MDSQVSTILKDMLGDAVDEKGNINRPALSIEKRAIVTLIEMLLTRGIKADKLDTIGSTIDETRMYSFGGILIIFSTKARISEKDLNTFVEYSKENNYGNGMIIIGMSDPSENVLSALRTHISDKENQLVQLFEIRHLQFPYARHIKMPYHRLVSPNEIPDILKARNAKDPSVFRKIDSQDPMAKWVGARPTDLIEVTGMCETSLTNKRYRFCMADVTNG